MSGPSAAVEEIIVIRLEVHGTIALPLALLTDHRVPEATTALPAPTSSALGSVPVILREDFLHAATPARRSLAVDAYGTVALHDPASSDAPASCPDPAGPGSWS